MIQIDIEADLNFVDDNDLVLARVPKAGAPTQGAALVIGTIYAWTWAVVHGVDDGWVRLRPVNAREAAKHNALVTS